MTRDEETYFLRIMQAADQSEFDKHFSLSDSKENSDGSLELRYDVSYSYDNGYMTLKYRPDNGELLACEMNVGFQTMIGLNRSPLELRIFAEHVIELLQSAANQPL